MTTLILTWRRLRHPLLSTFEADRVEDKIRRVLHGWEGTKYAENQQVRGAYADCIRSICGVLDELYGRVRTLPENLPADRALHDPEGARAAMRTLLRIYEPNEEVLDGKVEAGDVAVCGAQGGGPGHAMLIGPDPHTAWHMDKTGFWRTGIGTTDMEVMHVYRQQDKHLWQPSRPK